MDQTVSRAVQALNAYEKADLCDAKGSGCLARGSLIFSSGKSAGLLPLESSPAATSHLLVTKSGIPYISK